MCHVVENNTFCSICISLYDVVVVILIVVVVVGIVVVMVYPLAQFVLFDSAYCLKTSLVDKQ